MAEPRWAEDWDARFSGEMCVMCDSLGRGDSDYWIHVADQEHTEVYLDRGSQIRGYCLAVWKGRHVAEPTHLDADDATAYWQEVMAAGRAVVSAFAPLKVNYLTLGNTVPHLHTHIVPRYRDDPAAGGPIPWDLVVGPAAFGEEDLRVQAEALRRAYRAG